MASSPASQVLAVITTQTAARAARAMNTLAPPGAGRSPQSVPGYHPAQSWLPSNVQIVHNHTSSGHPVIQ